MTIQEQYELLEKTVRAYNPGADLPRSGLPSSMRKSAMTASAARAASRISSTLWLWPRSWRRS